MRRARSAIIFLGATLFAVSSSVQAQNAFTARGASVRAGPDRSYPLVAQLGPGAAVQVMGCLDDWSWCDVAFDDTRGWVYAPSLSYVYEDERVPLYSYAPSLGIPIVTFSLGAYWDRYYRRRPWFAQRNDWEHRRIPHRRPPGPPPHAGPPPRAARPPRAGPRADTRAVSPRGGATPRGGQPAERGRGGERQPGARENGPRGRENDRGGQGPREQPR